MSKGSESVGLLSINDSVANDNTTRLSSHLAYDSFGHHQVYQQQLKERHLNQFADTFLRKTMKFWVLPSNFTAVKRRILNHIPEWRYDGKVSEKLEDSGSFCESIYWDTDRLSLYNKRILQVDQSMLFRYRWYGNGKCKMGFMEQKIRKEAWRGEASVKQRFQLDPKLAPLFLQQGSKVVPINLPFVDQMYQDSRKWGGAFKPTLRTEYRRTVFQESNGAAVRMSFDEDVSLKDISDKTWEECLDPSVPVSAHKTFCFPLGILEVKLAFETFEQIDSLEMPSWVYAMQNAGFIIQVEKFSKYCTGCCVMNLAKIHRVPSWIAAVKTLMEVELARKGEEWFGMEKLPKWEIEENINIPTRVEPREFMANERTLLKWVRMCFLALFVGLGLLGFQYEPVTGSVLIIFAMIILFRSYWMYRVRLRMLIERNFQDPFHDPWGPPLLLSLFVLPTLTYLAYSLGLWSLHF